MLPSSPEYVEPLSIDHKLLKQDIDFLMNAINVHNKLPTYRILINGHPCKVLIDSGANANHIHSHMVPFLSTIKPAKQTSLWRRQMGN